MNKQYHILIPRDNDNVKVLRLPNILDPICKRVPILLVKK